MPGIYTKKSEKALSVIAGALLTGFMWRCRGSGGWGSFWGLTAVGTMLMLLIYFYYGHTEKFGHFLLPLGGLFAGLTVFMCGSVVDLGGGVLIGDALFTGEDTMRITVISQGTGIFILAIAGFALMCLFGVFTGTLFSKKKYGFWHYVLFAAIFFVTEIVSKLSISHLIAKLLIPEAAAGFETGLADRGEAGTAYTAYVSHFGNIRWANGVPYGYPYYEIIEHISFFICALALLAVVLFVFKDRTVFFTALGADTAGALGFVAGDYFNVNSFETSFLSKLNLPAFLRVEDWGLWEFTVGFVLGAGIMLTLALLPAEVKRTDEAPNTPFFKSKKAEAFFSFGMYTFIFGVVPARTLGIRTGRLFENRGITDNDEPLATILIIVLSLTAGIIYLIHTYRKMFGNGFSSIFHAAPRKTAERYLTGLIVFSFCAYFLLDRTELITVITEICAAPEKTLDTVTGMYHRDFLPAFAGSTLFMLIFFIQKHKNKTKA